MAVQQGQFSLGDDGDYVRRSNRMSPRTMVKNLMDEEAPGFPSRQEVCRRLYEEFLPPATEHARPGYVERMTDRWYRRLGLERRERAAKRARLEDQRQQKVKQKLLDAKMKFYQPAPTDTMRILPLQQEVLPTASAGVLRLPPKTRAERRAAMFNTKAQSNG